VQVPQAVGDDQAECHADHCTGSPVRLGYGIEANRGRWWTLIGKVPQADGLHTLRREWQRKQRENGDDGRNTHDYLQSGNETRSPAPVAVNSGVTFTLPEATRDQLADRMPRPTGSPAKPPMVDIIPEARPGSSRLSLALPIALPSNMPANRPRMALARRTEQENISDRSGMLIRSSSR